MVFPASHDFRSDTMTVPLLEMVQAVASCPVGDAVVHEDVGTLQLEARIAKLAGKEAGLFCVSGTLSNQIALRTHLHQPPYSILCDARAHVYKAEAAGLAILSQAMVIPVEPSNGIYLTLEDIKKHIILTDDIHVAPTKVISLENTLGGALYPVEEIARISKFAHENGLKMHLDGARLWNASAAENRPIEDYCEHFDTVSLCLSKGLSAPVGSMLVGPKEFIKKAEWFRKQQGGGIRQSGWLAAAAIVALDVVWPTMAATHELAKQLASWIQKIGVRTILPVQTNFVWMDDRDIDLGVFRRVAEENGLRVWGGRIALHYWTTPEAVELVYQAIGAGRRAREADTEYREDSAPTAGMPYRT